MCLHRKVSLTTEAVLAKAFFQRWNGILERTNISSQMFSPHCSSLTSSIRIRVQVFRKTLFQQFGITSALFRSLQVIDPVHYALGLAVAKRIPSYYADMSAEDYQKWDESVEKATKRIPKPVFAAACFFMQPIFEHLDFKRRNQATLDALGNIALKMSSDNSERPVLAYMGGQAHARPILSALCNAAVDYSDSATSFYPQGNSRKLRLYGRQIGSLLHMCESSTTNFQKQWLYTISQNQKL
jgi:hypothetical protein